MIESVFSPVFRSSILDGVFPITGPAAPTSPIDLFSTGAQGIWYDTADLTTMFQDSAGTTAVTTPGQPVGLRLDKSKGLVLGPDIVTNGTFNTDISGWTVVNPGVTSTSVSASGVTVTNSGLDGQGILRQVLTSVAGRTYRLQIDITSTNRTRIAGTGGFFLTQAIRNGTFTVIAVATGATLTLDVITFDAGGVATFDNIIVKELAGNHSLQATAGSRLTYGREPKTGTRNILLSTDTMATQSRTVTAAQHTLAFTGTGTVTLTGVSTAGPLVGTGAGNRVSLTFTPTAGSLTLTVLGSVTLAQLELGATATAYQRVTTAFDVTEAGVDSCHYLQYDGTDDSMGTAAIDFTGTDAVSVFAGIRRSSDATLGVVLEFGTDSTNNNGSFALRSPNTTASAAYSYASRGTALSLTTSPASFSAPRYNLLTGLSDISADQSVLRVNGVQVSSNTADQGTGAYANQALFSGRRNNTNLPFSGRDYGMLVVGKNTTAAEISFMESWFAARTPTVTI